MKLIGKIVAEFAKTLTNLCRANVEVHPRALAVLLYLNGVTTNERRQVSAIMQELNLPGAAASRHGKQLERDGYITRVWFPADNRRVMYCLTAKGQELADRVEAGYPAALEEALA